ncbi:RNA-binding protein [Candidatus Bathyarchaeota archaeon]|nr:MAG: RNA-binding protein [Candidatus Bathyarchaeota archaeon]
MPKCSWCNKTIVPKENFVRFVCPNCGGVTITRCRKCREFGRPYKCPKCGFTGP